MLEGMINAWEFLAGTPDWKTTLGKARHRLKDNIKIDLPGENIKAQTKVMSQSRNFVNKVLNFLNIWF